ncbi:cytochrome b/b6 domain-containing protein [Streptomyces sp. TX20-6-3]|uniref:cytochrome b n=1 Tax=Streptomyces sp. TX20-6-3 TaxID=3028705 RepID=UPI0029B87E0C|nr:cytochrome b/b6 domain-containing protein [Streptomyces sp. TX20-6-3]MDX2563211.1 cytochrome b/b6 domain-containing protein [Streptomyces sp. TX20-6-3]
MGSELRNGPHGYGIVTKTLHWTLFAAIAAQFAVGYLLDADDGGRGRGRGRGRGEDSGRGRGRGGDHDAYTPFGDDTLLTVHVVLGGTVLLLGITRLVWRLATPLPPWAPTLTAGERRLAHATELVLYTATFAAPVTGLALLLSGDDLLPVHIAAQVLLHVAVAAHVGLVLKHQLVNRDHLLARML